MLDNLAGSLWLPFTQMQGFDRAARTFVRGEGNYLIDASGRRIFDAVSSVWTTVHGHCHPAIVRAIADQAQQLDHATLLGATNPGAEQLAEMLTGLLRLDYAFFASDGASAVEAALKMAINFWQQAGQPQRTRFVRLVDAYHGDTAGAMSVSDIAAFKQRFGAIVFETIEYGSNPAMLERDDIAAAIVEPAVQAAAGMRIVPRERYEPLGNMTPLLIVDEIATGFGRTGTMFAHEPLRLNPDIVCVGKGLSGGTLPISATVVKRRVFDAFLGAPAENKQFFHGHSYAGNPIACAAAIANIELFQTQRTLEHVRLVADAIVPALTSLRSHPQIRDVRQAGLMIGIEVRESGRRIAAELYERGHFTRAIGEVVQLVPPLSTNAAELLAFIDDLHDVLA